MKTFPVPTPSAGLAGIAAGPGGLVWFTEEASSKVGSITTAGKFREYPVPDPDKTDAGLEDTTGPTSIAASGNKIWFLTDIGDDLYTIRPGGPPEDIFNPGDPYNATLVAPSKAGGVWLLMQGGDGRSQDGDALELISPKGIATGYPATHPNTNDALALAPDGSIWYNDEGLNLTSLTTGLHQRNYPVSSTSAAQVSSIAFSRSGTPFFTEYAPGTPYIPGSKLRHIPAKRPEEACCGAVGTISDGKTHIATIGLQLEGDGLRPFSMVRGPDGDIWFAFTGAAGGYNGIGRIVPSTGHLQLASTGSYFPDGITFGADGALWSYDYTHNVIGRISPSQRPFQSSGG